MIKNTHKKANRKITDYSDGFVKTRPAEETKADWEYSVWSGAGAQPAPSAKRKRGAPKKERSDVKQSKLEQMTLVCDLFFKPDELPKFTALITALGQSLMGVSDFILTNL